MGTRNEMPQTAREWLETVLDPGWAELFDDVVGGDPLSFPGYPAQLEDARRRTGCSESVVVARGAIGAREVVAFSFEFGFLGGSMGVAAGERIRRACELAAGQRQPVIGLVASGGARMQEGMAALAQMAVTVVAREELARARQPFLCYLRDPATGGVLASFASLADLLWAQPGCTTGFAGPRVAEAVTGEALPPGSHTAETALEAALVDDIVEPAGLKARLELVLALLGGAKTRVEAERPDAARAAPAAWSAVELARHPARPTGVDYLDDMVPLRRGGVDPTLATGIARFGGRTVVAIAQDRRAGTGRTTPAGYRRARRAIALADRLGLSLLTLVDTPGAEPGPDAERDGVAREIAETFAAMLARKGPGVACVVGEGGSGGALALAAADRVLIQENAIFSVIAPEGAARILRRDDVAALARDLRLGARDLLDLGIADAVVPEPPGGAQADPAAAREALERAVEWAFGDLWAAHQDPERALFERWRSVGALR